MTTFRVGPGRWRDLFLLGVAVMGLLAGCGGPVSRAPAWVLHPPSKCYVGGSGPTIIPGRAVRYAIDNARAAVAAAQMQVKVQVRHMENSGDVDFRGYERVQGFLRNTKVVALWTKNKRATFRISDPNDRQVYALACPSSVEVSISAEAGVPSWVTSPPTSPGRPCALGISGPTVNPYKQGEYTREDGAEGIASMMGTRIEQEVEDDGSEVYIFTHAETPPDVVERILPQTKMDQEWLDKKGNGPLGLPGVLYGLVCMDG